jgi:hypothetical protein
MARYLISVHGPAAAKVARDRVDALEATGETSAAAVWREIHKAIGRLAERP